MIRQFWRDRRGAAAVEFALIAPGMVALMFGLIEVNEINIASLRTNYAAAGLADVTSREATINNSEMTGAFDATSNVIFPGAGAALSMRVTSVEMVSATQGRAQWSDARGMSPYAPGANVALPPTVNAPCATATVILAETKYTFRSPAGMVLGTGDWPITRQVIMCPRVGQAVARDTTS